MSSIGVLFVVLVCGQALAAGEQRLAASDGKVSVAVQQKSASASSIQSCLTSETSYNVRLQSIRSKTTSFIRVLMNMSLIETYASKLKNGTAQHIGDCAEMADEGGFAGFSFVDGLCKMFSRLERHQPCRCDVGTGDLSYVQDSFWDKKDLHLPNLESVGGEVLESVAYSRTVFDKRAHVDPAFKPMFSFPSTTPSKELMKSLNYGGVAVACEGDTCSLISLVDVKHCSVGCSSTLVVRRLFTYKQRILDEVAPIKYFLSECGNTITLNGTPSTSTAGASRLVFSHKGYGCQWYTKDAEDSECAVTFSSLSRGLGISSYNIDGNTTSCEGDAVTVYKGASRNGPVLKTITACNNTASPSPIEGSGEMFVVFKRSTKQYRQDGFNFGFGLSFY